MAPANVQILAPRAPFLKRPVKRHFAQDRKTAILGFGCALGTLLYFLTCARYERVRWVDGSHEQMLAACRLRIDGVEEGDLLETLVGQEDGSPDVLVAFDVIEHFTRDELLFRVDEVGRILRPGGRWIIHVPNGESSFSGRMRYGDLTHELAFTRTSLAQLLLSSGFSAVECYEDEPVVHGIKSAARWVLWKVIRVVLRLYIAAETGDTCRECIFSQNLLAVAVK